MSSEAGPRVFSTASSAFSAHDAKAYRVVRIPVVCYSREPVDAARKDIGKAKIGQHSMEQQKHSGIGIASFILSLLGPAFFLLLVIVASALEASTPGGMDENSAAAGILGISLIAVVIISIVSFFLGIGGLLQADRKKVFSVLGLVFSAGGFFLEILLLLLGMVAS